MLKQKRWQSLIHQYCELRAEMSKYDPSRVSGLMRKSLGAKEREFWAARANSEIKQHESSLWAPSPAKGKQKLAPLRLFPPLLFISQDSTFNAYLPRFIYLPVWLWWSPGSAFGSIEGLLLRGWVQKEFHLGRTWVAIPYQYTGQVS